VNNSAASDLNDNYKEALNLVKWAYWREKLDVRSAGSLAIGDKTAIAEVNALSDTLASGETADVARVKLAYKSATARLKVAYADVPALSAAEQAAAKLIPVKKPVDPNAPPAGRGGGPGGGGQAAAPGAPSTGSGQAPPAPPTLTGYYTQEANNFADGTRSILDVRNAIAAEFGPVPLENVVNYFRNLERQGTWTIK